MAERSLSGQRWWPWALALAVFALFAHAGGNAFINFDDDAYILVNPHVNTGLSPENVAWAFTNKNVFYWQPLAWLSHQLDVSLFGLNPSPPHIENALLHALNAFFCFALMKRLTGSAQLALAGAALWALHPLRVESVVWAAERKDVLSTLFCLLATLSYLDHRPLWRTGIFYALGLMTKPTLVTLPVIFLLLDVWPLKRRAYLEKWPLFAAAAICAMLTISGQDANAATSALGELTFGLRMGHALTNSGLYLLRTVWPANLTVIYPYDFALALWKPALAALILAALSYAAWRWRAKHPAAALGWFWFLITLAPISGVIQAGPQAGADRFTYIPAIGLSLAFFTLWPRLHAPALALSAVFAYVTFVQIGYWRDSVTLFTRAIAVTEGNWIALRNLANGLVAAGRVDEGIARFKESLAIQPRQVEPNYQLGSAIASKGDWAAALPYFEAAIALKPEYGSAQYAAGVALLRTGREAAAIPALERSLTLNLDAPYKADAHNTLGALAANRGDLARAEQHFREAVRLNPSLVAAQDNLRRLLGERGPR